MNKTHDVRYRTALHLVIPALLTAARLVDQTLKAKGFTFRKTPWHLLLLGCKQVYSISYKAFG